MLSEDSPILKIYNVRKLQHFSAGSKFRTQPWNGK